MGALLAAVEDYSTDNRWVSNQPIKTKTHTLQKANNEQLSLAGIVTSASALSETFV